MEISSVGNNSASSYCPSCGKHGDPSQSTGQTSSKAGPNKELSDEEKKQVTELKKRDNEVKTHEAAHAAAGGAYVRGGASYEYQTGPDGNKYAVGGEVPIDASPVSGDPGATIRKMQIVKAAALAPAQPSSADTQIAAKASMEAAKAQSELMQNKQGGAVPATQGKLPIKGSERQYSAITGARGISNGMTPNVIQMVPSAPASPLNSIDIMA